jgi:fido (protein-threonine AMPylation protein)
MPFPWDEDDPQVRSQVHINLDALRFDIVASGRCRDPFTLDIVKDWHRRMLDRVPVPQPEVAGGFRGSGPQDGRLRTYRVTVDGILEAVRPGQIRAKMSLFERRLREQVAALDPLIPAKAPPDQRESQVLELSAWAHGELIHIHPFADGNGRMARALVLWLVARYGLPIFIDLGPRPDDPSGYEAAARASMTGRHQLMQITLTKMLAEHRNQGGPSER